MEPNQGIKTWQWVVTVIIIIVLVILGYYMFKGDGITTETKNETPITEEEISSNQVNRIMVNDQYPGNVVYVTSAQFENPGWVSIREDSGGAPGTVIGFMYFGKGTNSGKITLSKNTTEGKLYYAVLHADDGDRKFDTTKDLTLKDNAGNVIMKTFRATVDITEIKG